MQSERMSLQDNASESTAKKDWGKKAKTSKRKKRPAKKEEKVKGLLSSSRKDVCECVCASACKTGNSSPIVCLYNAFDANLPLLF